MALAWQELLDRLAEGVLLPEERLGPLGKERLGRLGRQAGLCWVVPEPLHLNLRLELLWRGQHRLQVGPLLEQVEQARPKLNTLRNRLPLVVRQPLLELSKEGVTFGLCLCVEGHEAKALAARWQRERSRSLRPLQEGAWLDLDKEHRLVHEERVVCICEGRRRGHPQQLGDRA